MKGETIVCVAPRLWDSLWRESQQLMSRIARQNRVLYVEPGHDYTKPHLAELWRNSPNLFSLRARKVHDNLIVIPTPPSLPMVRRHLPHAVLQRTAPLVAELNARILIRQVRWAMRSLDVQAPILWLNEVRPELVGKFGEKLSLYYNYDEQAEFAPNAAIKSFLRQRDERLTEHVDVVICTSRAQWQRRKVINPSSYFVPNGVDFDMFNRALDAGLPVPADITAVPRPIIGFAGWLSYYIDVSLLRRVAEAYLDCSLVLVGPDDLPDSDDLRRLRALPNVFFLGKKERWELPNYLQVFDAALMPWTLSGHVLSAYPLKLHEYLAAGRPTVSVALPELEPFGDVIRIARTPDEFISHVRQALHDHSPPATEARVAVAKANTWDHRVADIYRVLSEHLMREQGHGEARLSQLSLR